MEAIKQRLMQMLTEKDNQTFCVLRVLALLAVPAGIFFAGYDLIVLHTHFDFQQYGLGAGGLFTGVGAALKLKPESAS
jgi:hypothetical protein